MAGEAIEPVQLQMLVKLVEAEESLQGRFLHPRCIGETHVVGNERQNLVRFVIGKAETAANLCSDPHSHFHMAVETDAVRGNTKSGRFAYIVQQGCPGQGDWAAGRKPIQQQERMYPHIAFRVVLRRLRHTFHLYHFRQGLDQQPGFVEQLEGAPCSPFGEHPGQLISDPFVADLAQARRQLLDCPGGRGLQCKREAGSKAHSPQHAQFVFGEALAGVPDGTDQAGIQVVHAAHHVQDRVVGWVQHHAVDGEVAALYILFRTDGEAHCIRVPAVGVGAITAEGSDFGHYLPAPRAWTADQNDAEMRAYGKRLVEQGEHLIGLRTGGNVEILRFAAQQQVTHATANEVGLVAGGAKTGNNLLCRLPCRTGCRNCHVYYYRNVSQPSQLLSVAEGANALRSGLILAIESSCDETAAAVVERGRHILSSVVASQIAIHAPYGGVVPELASREHLRNVVPVVRTALEKAGVNFADLEAIAVTEGPGLAGALLVGVAYAKSLAFALCKPLIAVNHLEGHIHAVLLAQQAALEDKRTLALVVSGGHTHLYLTRHEGESFTYRNVGATLDDAAGEAFDKVAKLLGLGYPGGPWIDALAPHGDPSSVAFTLTQVKQKAHRPGAPKDALRFPFSFSGIKTAVLRYVQIHDLYPSIERRREALAAHSTGGPTAALPLCDSRTLGLIASFQRAVVDDLKRKTFQAAEALGAESILVSGGVAANRELRERFTAEAARRGLPIAFPSVALSTDNAAMIAAAAWPRFLAGSFAPLDLTAHASLPLGYP
jgi:N6-L-threonylcarbamoyladenine synthase